VNGLLPQMFAPFGSVASTMLTLTPPASASVLSAPPHTCPSTVPISIAPTPTSVPTAPVVSIAATLPSRTVPALSTQPGTMTTRSCVSASVSSISSTGLSMVTSCGLSAMSSNPDGTTSPPTTRAGSRTPTPPSRTSSSDHHLISRVVEYQLRLIGSVTSIRLNLTLISPYKYSGCRYRFCLSHGAYATRS